MEIKKDPLPIEQSYAECFVMRLIDADFMSSTLGGAISSVLYGNNVQFTYSETGIHIRFDDIEEGAYVMLEISTDEKKENLEGKVLFDKNIKGDPLPGSAINEILKDYVIMGLRSVYSDSK
jgi:hypothetical protein